MWKPGSCAIEGCVREPIPGHVMCHEHWSLVPDGARAAVWRAIREGKSGAPLVEEVKRAAITWACECVHRLAGYRPGQHKLPL